VRAELLIPGGDAGLLSHRDASTVRRVRYREPVASLRMTKCPQDYGFCSAAGCFFASERT